MRLPLPSHHTAPLAAYALRACMQVACCLCCHSQLAVMFLDLPASTLLRCSKPGRHLQPTLGPLCPPEALIIFTLKRQTASGQPATSPSHLWAALLISSAPACRPR